MYIGNEFFDDKYIEIAKDDKFYIQQCKSKICPLDYHCIVDFTPEKCNHVLSIIEWKHRNRDYNAYDFR